MEQASQKWLKLVLLKQSADVIENGLNMLLKSLDNQCSVLSCRDDRLLIDSSQLSGLERRSEIDTIVECLCHVKLVENAGSHRFA